MVDSKDNYKFDLGVEELKLCFYGFSFIEAKPYCQRVVSK